MANVTATATHETNRLAVREDRRKWSRQTSALAIIAMSLLGWLALGGVLRALLSV